MAPFLSSMGFRVAVFNMAYFSAAGFNLPYLPVLLRDGGYGDTEIGLILATAMYLRVFVLPPLGVWTDGLADRATAVKLLAALTLCGVAAFAFSSSFAAIFMATVLFTLAFQSIGPIGETICLTMERNGIATYGVLRSIGSASFLACNLLGGLIMASFGPKGIFMALVLAFIALALSAFQLPVTSGRARSGGIAVAKPLPPVKSLALWKQRNILQVILANAFIQGSHAVLNGFVSLFWHERGFSPQTIGLLWATGVISEIVVFQMVSPRFRWADPRALIIVSGAVCCLRWTLFPLPYDEEGAFWLQMMHGGSFAIAHLGTMRFILKRVGEGQATAAQGLNVMLGGLTMATCMALAGPLFHTYGGLAFFPMVFPAVIGIWLAIWAMRRDPMPLGKERVV